uniref:Helicase ATP-binding domain-containing protein n=1 Tax=viral metagenome TaxID=1070528 RepID=A0A6C0D0Y7_9ZZZZ
MTYPVVLKNIINKHKINIMDNLPDDEEELYKYYDKLLTTPVKQTDLEVITTKMIKPNSLYDINIKKLCIKEKLENIEINNKDKDYNGYPLLNDSDFYNKINNKAEFNTVITNKGMSCDSNFELTPHQIFLKQFLSNNTPYNGILLFHGTGTGKTCTGISIAENFKNSLDDNKIIVLLPNNMKTGWINTVLNKNIDSNQCTGNTYLSQLEDMSSDKEVKKIVSRNYEFSGYLKFANSVNKIILRKDGHQIIKKIFSNRVIVIDEVQRIRGDDDSKLIIDVIKYIIKYSINLKLILLSATPMYNQSDEILTLLNLLLLNDNKIPIPYSIFKDGFLTREGKQILINKCKGYISYVRGERKNLFPDRLYPDNILKKSEYPIKDILGNEVDYKFRYLQLYPSYMSGEQKKVYNKKISVIKKESRNKLILMEENELTQISNIVYPVESDKPYGKYGLENTMNIKKNKIHTYSYKTKILNKYGPIFDINIIKNYSTKIKTIIDSLILDKSEGIVFIYSRFIVSGIIPMILALEQNGYQKYSNDEILVSDTKREPISYDGTPISKYKNKNDFIRGKYIAITGDSSLSSNYMNEIRVAISDENKNGEKIKIILGSEVASEGLDLKNVRSIHILDPWHHLNRVEQIIGRGIRFCSHKTLPKDKRNVNTFIHCSMINNETDSSDTIIYRIAEKKSIQIGEVESLLKKVSIDCKNLKPLNYDKDDKPYSKVCSYQPDCDFDCMFDFKKSKLNYDTLNLSTFYPMLLKIANYISNIYLHNIALTIDEIYDELSTMITIDKYIIYLTIDYMIKIKFKLKHNDIDGFLIYNNNYYIFQPFNKIDQTIPVIYRISNNNFNNKYKNLIKSKKTLKKYNTPELNQNVTIDNVPSLKNHKLIKLFDFDDRILFYYDIERFSFTQKASLIKDIILKLPNINGPDEYIFEHYRNNFIYKTDVYEIDKDYPKNVIPVGFFLYVSDSYTFFLFDDKNLLYEVDDVTNDEFNTLLNEYKNTDKYIKKYRNCPPIWGYNYIAPKKIVTAVDFKLVKWVDVKDKNKKIKDGGLGYQCNSNNQFSKPSYTIDLIKTYFGNYYKSEIEGKNFKVSKKYICILFELILRNENFKNKDIHYFYNYDISYLYDL